MCCDKRYTHLKLFNCIIIFYIIFYLPSTPQPVPAVCASACAQEHAIQPTVQPPPALNHVNTTSQVRTSESDEAGRMLID